MLHGGVDTEGLVAYSKQESRDLLNLSPSDLIIGLCNVCQEDHLDNEPFFRSVNAVAAESPKLKLLVSGQKEYIETEIAAMIPPERLINIGWQPYEKYNQYLSACDFFALPFPDSPRNAGRWPNKIGDYLWLERPVITNPTGDIKSFMEQNESLGFCVEATEHGYTSALTAVCEQGVDSAKGFTGDFLSKAGLLTVSQRQARILEIYQELVGKG